MLRMAEYLILFAAWLEIANFEANPTVPFI